MTDLAKMIDEAATASRNSNLQAITLYPIQDGWQANVKRKIHGQEGWCCRADRSPSVALLDALRGAVSSAVIHDRPKPAPPPAAPAAEEDIFG